MAPQDVLYCGYTNVNSEVSTRMQEFVAIYRSSTSSETGCVKRFATTAWGQLVFPPQVAYPCDLCRETHHFRLDQVMTVGTPGQRANMTRWCQENRVETDVEVARSR
jgi:hypothetical protein